MAHSPARPTAPELLAIPVITDRDVLDRVAAIISPAARRYRTLWLFFLPRDGIQPTLLAPVDPRGARRRRPGAAGGGRHRQRLLRGLGISRAGTEPAQRDHHARPAGD